MTRDEFRNDVTTWSDLYSVAEENDYYFNFDLYLDEDEYNSAVIEDFRDYLDNGCDTIDDARDVVESYPYCNFCAWIRSEYGEWYGTDDGDDYFSDAKEELREYLEDEGFFDDEEDDDGTAPDERVPVNNTEKISVGTSNLWNNKFDGFVDHNDSNDDVGVDFNALDELMF